MFEQTKSDCESMHTVRPFTERENPIYSWAGYKDLWCLMGIKYEILFSAEHWQWQHRRQKQKKKVNILTFMGKELITVCS